MFEAIHLDSFMFGFGLGILLTIFAGLLLGYLAIKENQKEKETRGGRDKGVHRTP